MLVVLVVPAAPTRRLRHSQRHREIGRNFRHAKRPSRPPRLASPADPGSGTLLELVAEQPPTMVWPANVFVFCENTQPLIVPASVPLPPDAADMVKLVPARMSPSKTIGPEVPTLIVAASLTTQKMLSACAPFCSVKVIAPFTTKSPSTWITKTALGLLWALKIKLVPVIVEMVPEDA